MKRTLLNFVEKLKKPLHILTAFAVIICSAFSVPVFANNETVSLLPDIGELNSSNYQNGLLIATTDRPFDIYGSCGIGENVVAFAVGSAIYAVSKTNTDTFYRYYSIDLTGEYVISNDTFYNGYYVYYTNFSNSLITQLYIPEYSNLEEGIAAAALYLENGDGDISSTWVNKPLVIPQGYTAVINTSNMTAGKGGFRLRANTGNLGNSNLWRDIFGNDNVQSGQAVYNTNTPITSYDFDDYPQLTWSPYEYSLLRATAYEYIGEATKSNTYTYIFNPIQGNATSIKNGQNTNSYITLYMNDQFDGTVKLYPLTSMAAVGQGQTIDVGNDESENAGSGDISNGTWTDDNGNVFTPPQGGGNGTGSSQNPLEAIAGTIEHLGEVLNQFVGGLSTILTAPVEAIQTLINNGSAFVSHLSGLYSWLPAQVYSTLTSAIILCITVGVLKVLL